MALTDLGVLELSQALARRETSSVEATRACLARIAQVDGQVGAFLCVDEARALAAAEASDARRAAGSPRGPLDGVPVAVKDNLLTQGLETTCGSRALEGFVPPYSATAVRLLEEAGLPLLGKLNQDEFAMGSSSETSAYGPCRNPWELTRSPGGSSGGSAAAVAAREAYASLGTDTGGSIRQPAALTNLVGLKPTYGRVSRHGVIAFASSLDQVGPLTRTVGDAAALLQILARHDPQDSTSAAVPTPDYAAGLEVGVEGLRLGVPREYFEAEGVDPEVRARVQEALATYARLGARLVDVSLPHTKYALATYHLIAPAEASANLARYDGVRYGRRAQGARGLQELYARTREEGFGPEVKRRIMLGTYALSAGYYDAYYLRAQKVRTLIAEDFRRAFAQVDALVSPTSPVPAFRLGEVKDPLSMYLLDVFTLPCNLAGLPGLSVPCGFTGAGLPVGLQLLGRPFDEATLLRAARALEREHDCARRLAPL
ncbi:Asp-tRNA(Asn)/Glu-tRNA(Gln) amidotransferase subunit GatA [Aggregicoccus sp. 17bor-14]|uniref:Asp-tRNA(Asn)/Glu-tRNA(Gln) amidotransferase subunit GatA n=1 Tax=Myxococcaceae TaxID=31 RepID=UPI0012F3692D|nr:Asp-tRNA(Asn)/Glu-tRNA(Gln) amidotransferase subunit GatA [Simulacricoccus sp. 17bor-14]MRI89489.1 Asp-tRNA(Asn)/Glu-tRNA(Gln) amidotransferase subunit GatA [Aggregicoccus sp. 17bor-14]